MESKDGEDVPSIGEDDHAVYVTRSGPLGTNAREDRLSDRTPLVDVIGHTEEELAATNEAVKPMPATLSSTSDLLSEAREKTEFEQYIERTKERWKRIEQVYPRPEEDWSTGEDDSSNCSTPQAVRESIAEEALGSPESPPDSMWDRPVQRQVAVTDEQVDGIRTASRDALISALMSPANSTIGYITRSLQVRVPADDDEPVPLEHQFFVAAPTAAQPTRRVLNPHRPSGGPYERMGPASPAMVADIDRLLELNNDITRSAFASTPSFSNHGRLMFRELPPPFAFEQGPAFGFPVVSATDVTSRVTLPSPPAPVEPEEADAEVPAFENDTDPRNNNKTQNIEDIIRCPVYQMAMRYPIQARCCGVHFGRAGALGVLNSRKKKCPLCNKPFEVIPGVDKVLQDAIRVEVEKHGYEYDEDELEHMQYRCPIALKIMRYPVRLECCGRVLSQYVACQHFNYHDWCPFCKQDTLIPVRISYTLKNLIDACVARGDFKHDEDEQTDGVTSLLKHTRKLQEERERTQKTLCTWTPKSAKQSVLDNMFRDPENRPMTEHTGVHNREECVMLVLLEAALPGQLDNVGLARFRDPNNMDIFIAGTAHAWKHIWKRLRLRMVNLPGSHQIITETRNGSDEAKMRAVMNYVSESSYRTLWNCALEGLMDAQTWWPPRGTKLYAHRPLSNEMLGREMASMFGNDCTDLGLPKDFESNTMIKAVGARYCRSPRENIANALLSRHYNIGIAAAYMTHHGRAKNAEMLLQYIGVKPLPDPIKSPAQEITAEFLDELTHRLCTNNTLMDMFEAAISRRKPAKKPRTGLWPLLE